MILYKSEKGIDYYAVTQEEILAALHKFIELAKGTSVRTIWEKSGN